MTRLLTLGGKRCQEAILSGSERGLDFWRSPLGTIVVVIISKADARGSCYFVSDKSLPGHESLPIGILKELLRTGRYPQGI